MYLLFLEEAVAVLKVVELGAEVVIIAGILA
jgi:hypothetical protein